MSEIFDSIEIREDVKRQVDHSFAVADQIHFILQKQGKTQRDLAKSMGKNESEVSKWMSGMHNFTTKGISKIEMALDEPIIITPIEASKKYANSKFIPVKIYTIVKNPKKKEVTETHDLKWKKSRSEIFDKGLKIA